MGNLQIDIKKSMREVPLLWVFLHHFSLNVMFTLPGTYDFIPSTVSVSGNLVGHLFFFYSIFTPFFTLSGKNKKPAKPL